MTSAMMALSRNCMLRVGGPASGPPPRASAADGLPRPAMPARRRVLVVDDNVDAAQTLSEIFELYDQDVRTAYSSAEALRVAAEWQPQAAVLDIGMPEIDGNRLCRRLRALASGPQPLLIALTGSGGDDTRQRALEAGFDAFFVKPVEPDQLLNLLRDRPPLG